jgi:hypothetical protein
VLLLSPVYADLSGVLASWVCPNILCSHLAASAYPSARVVTNN